MIYQELFADVGHLSWEKTFQVAKERFILPYIQHYSQHHVTNVSRCMKQRRSHIVRKAPINHLSSSVLFELISVDFLNLEKGNG